MDALWSQTSMYLTSITSQRRPHAKFERDNDGKSCAMLCKNAVLVLIWTVETIYAACDMVESHEEAGYFICKTQQQDNFNCWIQIEAHDQGKVQHGIILYIVKGVRVLKELEDILVCLFKGIATVSRALRKGPIHTSKIDKLLPIGRS